MVAQKMLKEIGKFLDEDDSWSAQQKGMQCLVRFKIEMRDSKLDIKNKLLVQQLGDQVANPQDTVMLVRKKKAKAVTLAKGMDMEEKYLFDEAMQSLGVGQGENEGDFQGQLKTQLTNETNMKTQIIPIPKMQYNIWKTFREENVDKAHEEIKLFDGFDEEVDNMVKAVMGREDLTEDNQERLIEDEVDRRDANLRNLMCEDTEKY